MRESMGRSFTKSDAIGIEAEHNNLMEGLQQAANRFGTYRDAVSQSADAMVREEVQNILKGIPVEELNRSGAGLRIKNLKDSGYNNIADIASRGMYEIAAVDGISENGARMIKQMTQEFTERARKDTRIKLNADSRNPLSNALIGSGPVYMILPLQREPSNGCFLHLR